MDISSVLPLPSPSSSSRCQKRVTAVMPTVLTTLGSHRSVHLTAKEKAQSDRTDNPEKNPTKNSQKGSGTRPHELLEALSFEHTPPHAPSSSHSLPHASYQASMRLRYLESVHVSLRMMWSCLCQRQHHQIMLALTSTAYISTRQQLTSL